MVDCLIMANWSFLTSHARVLMCIAHDPGARLRDIAASLGITERSARGIVCLSVQSQQRPHIGTQNVPSAPDRLRPPMTTQTRITAGSLSVLQPKAMTFRDLGLNAWQRSAGTVLLVARPARLASVPENFPPL
jgi:hypothetical protein